MPPDSQPSRLPSGLLYLGVIVGGVIAVAIVGLFAYSAVTPDSELLPYRWRAWLESVTGDGKVVRPQADRDPAPWVAPKPVPADDAPPADGAEATAALAPIEAAGLAADKAIAAYRESRDDPKLALAAQQAIDAIRRISVNVRDDEATRVAVTEVRDEKAAARQHALEDARRVSRATHEVFGVKHDVESPFLVLRAAAHPQARDVAHLNDGDRLHEFLRTGSGWSRVEVLTGPATGQNGYVHDKFLRAVGHAPLAK